MRHLDLFSGIGGFALASNWAGYTTVGFCEIDDYCQRVLRKHWPDVPVWGDVRQLDGRSVADATRNLRGASGDERSQSSDWDRVDLITAGYPCQPFSLAGKRLGAADDRHLWPEVARLIGELRPRWFLGENVAGHINMGLDDVLSDLETLGYTARPVVIPACAVNAPHRRDRVWIMGHANEQGSQGHGQHGERASERIAGQAGVERREDVADAESGVRFGAASGATGHFAFSGEATPHTAGEGLEGGTGEGLQGRVAGLASDRIGRWTEAQQRVGVPHDGLPGQIFGLGGLDAFETHDQRQVSTSFPGHPTVPGMRFDPDGAAASPDLRDARGCAVPLHRLSRESGSTGRASSCEAGQDLPDMRRGVQALHARSEQDVFEGMPVGTGAPERYEALASRASRLTDPRWGGDPLNAFGPGWEDGVPRVVATEKDRVHRLKALGNAIVPQVAYQVLLAMHGGGAA